MSASTKTLLLLACVAATCAGFRPQVFQLQHDVAQRRHSLAALQCHSEPDLRARPLKSPALPRDAAQNLETRLMRLERRLSALECTLHDTCSAIVQSDDVALMERQALRMGDIYRDTSFNTTRRPRILRQELMRAMHKNSMNVQPLMHMWHPILRPRTQVDELE